MTACAAASSRALRVYPSGVNSARFKRPSRIRFLTIRRNGEVTNLFMAGSSAAASAIPMNG